jgi:hypothetical protein
LLPEKLTSAICSTQQASAASGENHAKIVNDGAAEWECEDQVFDDHCLWLRFHLLPDGEKLAEMQQVRELAQI